MSETQPFAAYLKSNSTATHDSVDNLVMSVKPFSTPENYIKFLQLQAIFHKIVDSVYKDKDLNQKIKDLQDLNAKEAEVSLEIPKPKGAEALGWLYCAEGSNLGAAFLFKDAQNNLGFGAEHGARHLAPHMDGRGKHWRGFVAQFNELPVSEEEKEAALKGALEAFAFYKVLLRAIFEI